MKFLLIFCSLIITINICSFSQPDVRNVRWGMTKQEVKEIEMNLNIVWDHENDITYETILSDNKVLLNYSFLYDHLMQVDYMFLTYDLNKDEYLKYYSELRKILIDKYGKPYEETDTTFHPADYYTRWKGINNRTDIRLFTIEHEECFSLGIIYLYKDFKEFLKYKPEYKKDDF